MGEGDDMDDPQIRRDPPWELPDFSHQAGARMEEIHTDLSNKANGHGVKEKVNGTILHAKSNGHTNGLANGLTNGHANGHANGHPNGKTNGVLVPPDGDARVEIRANMWGVQEAFKEYKWEIKWTHVFMLTLVHGWALLGLMSIPYVMWQTWALRFVELVIAGLGVTAGAHRLYCHRAYKARLPLHLFLLWAYSLAGQNTLYDWVRDHRVHHKFSETDADPHNANRGWFFSHCGWLMLKKHPEVMRRGKTVDMSDITDDPLIRAHTKMFYVLKSVTCHMVPVFMPMLLWNEAFWPSTNSMMIRFAFTLNATWSVNSFAHLWGDRPIDKRIFPGENKLVSFFSLGEGWHNYHHVFPWDYKAAELGPSMLNIATLFLDICAWMGVAYDMKEPSKDLVRKTALKNGDGTWKNHTELQPVPVPPEKTCSREKAC